MINFIAEIFVFPHPEILDPQGKATLNVLHNLEFKNVTDLRIGKAMKMELMAENEDSARAVAEEACRKVLVNQVMEFYEIKIKTLEKIT